MELEFRCTVHDLKYGFDRKNGVEPALLLCPICANEEHSKLFKENEKLKKQRDALLEAIDIAKTVKLLGA